MRDAGPGARLANHRTVEAALVSTAIEPGDKQGNCGGLELPHTMAPALKGTLSAQAQDRMRANDINKGVRSRGVFYRVVKAISPGTRSQKTTLIASSRRTALG